MLIPFKYGIIGSSSFHIKLNCFLPIPYTSINILAQPPPPPPLFHIILLPNTMSMLRSLQSLPRTLTLFAAKDDHKAHSLLKILQDSRLSTDSDKQSNYEIDFAKNQYPTWEQLQLITSFTRTTPNGASIYRTVFPEFVNSLPPHEKYRDEFISKGFTGNSSWFKSPLVVDWEGQRFANDKTTLQTLIKSALAKSYS